MTFGLGEETGWRGFALPRLQRGHSALSATLILWALWALWHLPLFFYSYDLSVVPGLTIGLLAGAVTGSAGWISFIQGARGVLGGVSNPNDAYLLLRGLKTLGLRIQRQNESGLLAAQYLEDHPAIARVYYPGLESHPDHKVAARLMSGFGGVVSFEIDGDFDKTARFIDNLQLPYIGPTLGGVESIVQQPSALYSLNPLDRQEAGLKDNLVRYAVGVENISDILFDLGQALSKL